ncbi:MAG: hypothetical protein CSA18_02960 [Deltaproteobacteria bacterium]|nr:MAG: hypothetical protein CSA18_02960 [Deltaproteobacteria bacterium]
MKITFPHMQLASEKLSPCSGINKEQSAYESWWALDEEFGTGNWGRIELRPGFDLFISDFRVKESFVYHVESLQPGFGFGFWLSGETFGSGDHIPAQLYNNQGTAPLLFSPSEQSGFIREQRNSHRRSIVLAIEPDMLHFLLRGMLDNLPREYRMFLDGLTPGIFGSNSNITTAMYRIIEDLYNCPLEGPTRRLFLESKALELMALRLDQAVALEKRKQKPHELCLEDVERIRFAARQLCADLINPPSLFELSASVGMSHAKLTTGFKQVFTATPFEYLRQMRLNQAKMLLEAQHFNVTESAYAVGYNSLSSFARAFRLQYGYNPHECAGKKSRF